MFRYLTRAIASSSQISSTIVSRHSLTGSECACKGYCTSNERRQGANANIQVPLDDWHLESDVYLHCHRGRETHQTSSIGEKRSAPSGDVSQSCHEGTKLKSEAMELLGKLAPPSKPCSNRSSSKNKRSPILWSKQLPV